MKSILFLFLLFPAIPAVTQYCNEAMLLQKKGNWKKGLPGSRGGTAAEVQNEKKILDAIHNMIQSGYSPMGLEAGYQEAFLAIDPAAPANGYYYSIIPLNYYCDGDKLKTAHESSAWFQVAANYFDAEIYSTPELSQLSSGTGYHYIRDIPSEKDGIFVFPETDVSLGFGLKGSSHQWLVTYDKKLPFAFVTRKEFLETRKKILVNSQMQEAAGIKDLLSKKEMEKKFKEAEYKSDPEKLTHYLRMDFEVVKERYQTQLSGLERNYGTAFAKINAALQKPAAELNQPSIVKTDPHDPLSYLFTDDADPFGEVLIKPNPGYFNKKLPRSYPQFFFITLTGNQKEPVAAKFTADIQQALLFPTLKIMLGKAPGNPAVQTMNSAKSLIP
ncbi:MAG: hypothetical protein HYZ15_08450 [Sphingobacteriales bacterium]|nr:hypothetical protein [Sphingobacteriales bacterium]